MGISQGFTAAKTAEAEADCLVAADYIFLR